MNEIINSQNLKEIYGKSTDILIRPIHINSPYNLTVHIFCVDGLVNSQMLDLTIVRPLGTEPGPRNCKTEEELADYLLNGGGAYHAFGMSTNDFSLLNTTVMSGMCAILFDGLQKAVVFDVRTFDKRSLSDPTNEHVMKGAKDCFIEVLRSNTALIRRRIRSPHLTIEQMYIGKLSQTDVALVYLNNVCDMNLLGKIKTQLNNINIDNICTSSFIEEFIVKDNKTLMPQIMYTERPDRCCSNITDGRICLIVDGIPMAFVLPCQFPMLLQSPEDYSDSFIAGSALRILRYTTLLISLLLPAFYIAVTAFHNQLLPIEMLLSIQQAKANVPFSSWAEVLGLLLAFEILIEAGLRLPNNIGSAMSIVGGLVVGQAAVEANIISPVVVIIVALTGISGFTVPNQDLAIAIRVGRYSLAILSALAGFFGLVMGFSFIIVHLCSLNNFGVSYMAPFAGSRDITLQDTLFRYPIKKFKFRPDKIAPQNKQKQK